MTPVALDLRWAPKITAADVLCVARRFRLVGSLSLAGNAINAAQLDEILERCPVLAELDLVDFKSQWEPNTQLKNKHPKLKTQNFKHQKQQYYTITRGILRI